VSPTWAKIAYDAIAVVVNINSPDSIFHKGELKSILDGSAASNKVAVFDGLKETSTIRYVVDSVLRGKPIDQTRVFA
jgi:phosphate transport system substrate-binding protein